MTDARLAVLESKVNALMSILERVAKLESDCSNMGYDLHQFLDVQEKSITERQQQYISLMSKISELAKYTDDKISNTVSPVHNDVQSILIGMRTTRIIVAGAAILASLIIALYAAL